MSEKKKETEENIEAQVEEQLSVEETDIEQNTDVSAEDDSEQKEKKYLEVIEALNAEVAKYKDAYVRSAADMENYKRRAALELDKSNKFAISGFARDILCVADALDRALKAMPPEENRNDQLKNFIKGAEITRQELLNVFSKYKVEPIESLGKVFNPNYHKVIQQRDDNSKPEGTIVEEWQTGYMISDRVLREAMVIVTKKSAVPEETRVDTTA